MQDSRHQQVEGRHVRIEALAVLGHEEVAAVHAANRRKGVIETPVPTEKSTWWKGVRRLFDHEIDVPSVAGDSLTFLQAVS